MVPVACTLADSTYIRRVFIDRLNFRLILGLCVLGVVALLVVIFLARAVVLGASRGSEYSAVEDVPKNKVGLVLGCVPFLSDGQPNAFFNHRMTAAQELFKAGKVDYLLVSGDNHIKGYDEPTDMKNALIKRGIPADRIVCDYAGFSTLDSIVRADKVFQEDTYTVISQRFHNQRAIYIGQKHGLNVVGYNAADVAKRFSLKTRVREQAARVKTVLDIYVLKRGPKFLGEPIPIGPANS
jgi:SanA protein